MLHLMLNFASVTPNFGGENKFPHQFSLQERVQTLFYKPTHKTKKDARKIENGPKSNLFSHKFVSLTRNIKL